LLFLVAPLAVAAGHRLRYLLQAGSLSDVAVSGRSAVGRDSITVGPAAPTSGPPKRFPHTSRDRAGVYSQFESAAIDVSLPSSSISLQRRPFISYVCDCVSHFRKNPLKSNYFETKLVNIQG
jgi:hypothetical protein